MKIAYADPPYPGCAHLYKDQPDYTGEVDHVALVERLEADYDGWILHTAATPEAIAVLAPLVLETGARWMSWIKSFAAFKRNVSVAYAWEPVIVKAARKPVVTGEIIMRDWIKCPITMRRGLTGAKPKEVCQWAFHMVGAERTDELVDLYPGTSAVWCAWIDWCEQINYLPAKRENSHVA